MITTYAVTLTSDPVPSSQWITVVDLVSDWLADNYPLEDRPPGTFVRWREGTDDPVCRLAIDTNPPRSTRSNLLTVTMIREGQRIVFDLRNVTRPLTTQVTPEQGVGLPQRLLVQLVNKVLGTVTFRDAGRRISASSKRVSSFEGGQEEAAFVAAPSRNLPVVVEVIDQEMRTSSIFAAGSGPLAGLAHVIVLETTDALRGFVEFSGEHLLGPGSVTTYWAGSREHELFSRRGLPESSLVRERDALVTRVISTAARSLAAPRVPPPPIDDDSHEAAGTMTAADLGGDDAVWAAYEEGQRRIEELESAVASADRIIAEQREELERKGTVIGDLVLEKVNLELSGAAAVRERDSIEGTGVRTMADALKRAQEYFAHLTFLPAAVEMGSKLDGPDPMTVLKDLGKLNRVARQWQAGTINSVSFALACQNEGLQYRAGIGQVASQKFAEDYAIIWRGKTVLADAHIGRGKRNNLYRIYFHLDPETQDVVIGRIVRHLRGKHDS